MQMTSAIWRSTFPITLQSISNIFIKIVYWLMVQQKTGLIVTGEAE